MLSIPQPISSLLVSSLAHSCKEREPGVLNFESYKAGSFSEISRDKTPMGSFISIVSKISLHRSLHQLDCIKTMPILHEIPDDYDVDQWGPKEPIGIVGLVRYDGGRATENAAYIYVGAALGVYLDLNAVEICDGTCNADHKKW